MATGHYAPPRIWRSRWKRLLIRLSGWFFILLGIAGLVLPILQGLLFLAIGVYLLSLESEWARRLLEDSRRRWPKLARTMDEGRERAARIVRRLRR